MKKIIHFLIILITALTVSCSPANDSTDVRIHDIWVLESINGVTYSRAEGQSLHPTIEIYLEEARFSGNTGCNSMSGKVKVERSTILFSDIITTKMFCSDVDEVSFLSALKEADSYKIEKMRLYLFNDEKEIFVFRKID